MFSLRIVEIFKKTLFTEHLRMAASECVIVLWLYKSLCYLRFSMYGHLKSRITL